MGLTQIIFEAPNWNSFQFSTVPLHKIPSPILQLLRPKHMVLLTEEIIGQFEGKILLALKIGD
jgi:hypothetical protein